MKKLLIIIAIIFSNNMNAQKPKIKLLSEYSDDYYLKHSFTNVIDGCTWVFHFTKVEMDGEVFVDTETKHSFTCKKHY